MSSKRGKGKVPEKLVKLDKGKGKCHVCGKEDEGVQLTTVVTEAGIAELTIGAFICEGCWSRQFKQFDKEE